MREEEATAVQICVSWNALFRDRDLRDIPRKLELPATIQRLHTVPHPVPGLTPNRERDVVQPPIDRQRDAAASMTYPTHLSSSALTLSLSAPRWTAPGIPAVVWRSRVDAMIAILVLILMLGAASLPALQSQPVQPPENPAILPALVITDQPMPSVVAITGGDDPLQQPTGVAVAADGKLYVIDMARNHIRVFDPDGNPLATWGEEGSGPGQFRFSLFSALGAAGDLAVGPDGSLYVADTFNNRIQKLAADGTFLLDWGDGGAGPGQIFEPSGIGVDAAGQVYVAEASGVQIFTADGQFLNSWEVIQADGTPLTQAADIAIDAAGGVWITDGSLHRLVSLDADGTARGAFGSIGEDMGELHDPLGVTVDGTGNVYVAEGSANRVQIFDQSGASLGVVPVDTSGAPGLSEPSFIALGQDATLYVADTGNHRVLRFSTSSTLVRPNTETAQQAQADHPVCDRIGGLRCY
ncbi:MAG: NHL repeat-containing protein [Thermomicrobiales bacterium]